MERKQVMVRGRRLDVWEKPVDPHGQQEVLEAVLIFLPEEERTYVKGREFGIKS